MGARGDYVFCCGEDANYVTFVSCGSFEYILGDNLDDAEPSKTPPAESGEYILEGQWASEAVLWTQWMHLGDLQAITECQIIRVNAEQFGMLVKTNRPLLLAVRKYAELFVIEMNKLTRDELTDLMHQIFDPKEIVDESDLKIETKSYEDDEQEESASA